MTVINIHSFIHSFIDIVENQWVHHCQKEEFTHVNSRQEFTQEDNFIVYCVTPPGFILSHVITVISFVKILGSLHTNLTALDKTSRVAVCLCYGHFTKLI